MNIKLLKLQKRTIKQIQHATMRMGELNNILTIINLYLPLDDCKGIVKSLEKRVHKMEVHPEFAGKHERHKL